MKKIRLFLMVLCLLIPLALSACAAPATATPGSSANTLAGTNWKLASYGPALNPTPAAAGVETNLSFGNDGKLSGNFGCNSFGGDYTVKDDTIIVGSIITTLMACDGPGTTQETAAFQVLKDNVKFKLDGSTLTITSLDGGNVLTFTAAAGT
jgi:heat shock protein HslJ